MTTKCVFAIKKWSRLIDKHKNHEGSKISPDPAAQSNAVMYSPALAPAPVLSRQPYSHLLQSHYRQYPSSRRGNLA